MSAAPTHTGEVGTIAGVKVHAEEPPRHAKKAAYDEYAHSRAKLAQRQADEAAREQLELAQSEEAERQTRNLHTELMTFYRFLMRTFTYDPIGEQRGQDPFPGTPRREIREGFVPEMLLLARAVKVGVIQLMVDHDPQGYLQRQGVGVAA